MKYTDAHAHVFEPTLSMETIRRYTPDYVASVEEFIHHLDEHQMERGILIQPSFLGTDNSYMIEAINQYKTRLWGVAVIEPSASEKSLEELKANNIIGIRLNLYGKEIPNLNSAEWKSCLAIIKRLDWHVELHTDACNLPPLIKSLLEQEVKVVVDHFGKPDTRNPLEDEGFKYLLACGKTDRVWVKISANYRIGGPVGGKELAKKLVPILLEHFSSNRLLWGSDWPHTQNESIMTYNKAYEDLKYILPKQYWDDVLSRSVDALI